MAKTYKTYLPEQDLLLPPSLRDWLPENHLAYCVSDVVDQLDLSSIESVYEEEDRGQPPYHPRMMTKILVYGYCVGVFSSRRIQKRLAEDVAFRVLAAGNEPDFRTLSDFRKNHLPALKELFQQVLRLVLEVGGLKLGRVALDGSKVKANASKHKAMSYGRMGETEKRLRKEVQELLKRAEAVDKEEDQRYGRECQGEELPAELQRRETRIARIREAQKVLEERAREKAESSRWLLLCSHPRPPFPASALPPLTPAVTPAGTVLSTLANDSSESPIGSGNPAHCRPPIHGKPRLPPVASESGERKTLLRNSHTPGSWSSCADDTVVDPDLPLHTPTRLTKGPAGPPHPTHSKPSDSPATSHEGWAVTANLVREGRFCKSWP